MTMKTFAILAFLVSWNVAMRVAAFRRTDEDDPDDRLADLIESQVDRRERRLKKCKKKDEHQFFYKTSIHLEIAGANPQCSNAELSDIADLLADEYQTMLSVDPRLNAVFELETQLCSKIPTQKSTSNRRRQQEEEENSEHRKLDFLWYEIHHFNDWSERYLFDWTGIGDCRWCPYVDRNPDHRSLLLESSGKDEGVSANRTDSWKEQNNMNNHYNVTMTSSSSSSNSSSVQRRELGERPRVNAILMYEADVWPPKLIRKVNDFAIIDLKRYPKGKLTLVADANEITDSVVFGVDSRTNYQREGLVPFAVAGDRNSDGTLFNFPELGVVGTHTVTATPYLPRLVTHGDAFTISFLVVDSSVYDDEPDNDPELINILEEDLSFHLSYEVNRRFFRKRGHCLEGHLAYVHVDLRNIQKREHQC